MASTPPKPWERQQSTTNNNNASSSAPITPSSTTAAANNNNNSTENPASASALNNNSVLGPNNNLSPYSRYGSGYGSGGGYGGGYGSSYGSGYGSYGGGGYGSSYGGYGSSYGGYSRYGSGYGGYGSSMYGGRYGGGYGGGYGGYGAGGYGTDMMGGQPPQLPGTSIMQNVEKSVYSFGRFSELLHMNLDALHMSFSSVLQLLTNATRLRHEFGAVITDALGLKTLYTITSKLTSYIKRMINYLLYGSSANELEYAFKKSEADMSRGKSRSWWNTFLLVAGALWILRMLLVRLARYPPQVPPETLQGGAQMPGNGAVPNGASFGPNPTAPMPMPPNNDMYFGPGPQFEDQFPMY